AVCVEGGEQNFVCLSVCVCADCNCVCVCVCLCVCWFALRMGLLVSLSAWRLRVALQKTPLSSLPSSLSPSLLSLSLVSSALPLFLSHPLPLSPPYTP